MSFTITQQPNDENLYLYPSSSRVTLFTPVGASQNYDCVNEVWYIPNDDTDYVYWAGVSTASDWYNMENHTTETGDINYVRVISNAKSDTYTQSSSGIYKFFIYDGISTASSDNQAPLTTSYAKYYYTWNEKPSGGSWSWSDIDSMRIGIMCSSPSITTSEANSTFRPNGASVTHLSLSGAPYNWDAVDESILDTGDYVYRTSSYTYDLYTIPNHTSETGAINYIAIYAVVGSYAYSAGAAGNMKFALKTPISSVSYGCEHVHYSGGNHLWSCIWNHNYDTGSAWTWSDIDDLLIGVALQKRDAARACCYQLYLIVNYIATISPQIRTTQYYAVVNYTPATSTVTLNTPESLDVSHGRTIKRHIFQSGNYSVDDFGRSSKTLHLVGTETSDVSNQMNKLRNMCHYDAPVVISGLPDTNLNNTYRIIDFNFKRNAGEACIYDWDITLEEA